ncbi:MAG: DUF72 domain-containing protein [Microscillaceae bacterium]
MDFGKVPFASLARIDFSLPEDAPIGFLSQGQPRAVLPNIYTGCPVWANKTWVGTYYPSRAKEKNFLEYYARQFNTIELNTTHYRIPEISTVRKWREQVSACPHFKFAPKLPQEISHHLLPLGKGQEQADRFYDHIRELGPHLGSCFLQLPPDFAPDKIDKLEQFLRQKPQDFALAIEVRHPAWFKAPAKQEWINLLSRYDCATVLTDVAGRRDVLHMALSNSRAMIRFVGNDPHPSDELRIEEWSLRLEQWLEKGLREVYFFMHQPENNASPDVLGDFIQRLNKKTGLFCFPPRRLPQVQQASLF